MGNHWGKFLINHILAKKEDIEFYLTSSINTPTFKSINEVHASMIKCSVFFVMAGLIVEILFMLFSIYNALEIVNMKHNG